MAYSSKAGTTFGDLEIDERIKKLERHLKVAELRRKHRGSGHNGEVSPMITWPSVSSIKPYTSDFSCRTPLTQNFSIKSEVLASSNNLKNMFSKNKNHNTNQKAMTMYNIKQHNIEQKNHIDSVLMPAPAQNIVDLPSKKAQNKIYTSSNYEKTTALLNTSTQFSIKDTFSTKNVSSCISTNIVKNDPQSFIIPITPIDNSQKIDKVFSKWRVMLNNQCELIIKGTLECGKFARSKPIVKRYTATCIESKFRHKYSLQGNLVDENNGLPDYIRGKFYNGFPDDWENVYQLWKTYINHGCPLIFRWPTPVTDSDDDLRSELTDITHTCIGNNTATSIIQFHKKPIAHIQSKTLSNESSKNKKLCDNYSTHNSKSDEKNPFTKPFSSVFKKDIIPVAQAKNISYDKCNEQNVKLDVNRLCTSKRMNKLKDILHEDKFNVIINNLTDRNCSPKYIDKIIELFDCLDYAVSYRTGLEYNCNSTVSASCEMSELEAIPVQQVVMSDDNRVNTIKFENKTTEPKNYVHCTDLGYGSVKNDTISTHQSKLTKTKSEHDSDKDLDRSQSEIYAGIPKISFEQILETRKAFGKIYRRKVRKKKVNLDAQRDKNTIVSITNTKENLYFNESCVSITEDEIEATNTRKCHKRTRVAQRQQEMTFSNQKKIQNNNFEMCREDKPITCTQNEQPFNAFETQRINLNGFMQEPKVLDRAQKNVHSRFLADVGYSDIITNSDVDVASVNRNMQKTDGSTVILHTNLGQDIVISGESNNLPEKPHISRESCTEFIDDQPKDTAAMLRLKPAITGSIPMNLNLRICNVNSKSGQPHDLDINIKDGDKQCTNIRPTEKTQKTSIPKTSAATKPVVITNDSNIKMLLVDKKKKVYPIRNNNNESDNINSINLIKSTNPIIKQSKSNELGVQDNPKVLTSWIPKVVYYAKSKSELGLTFQGKLLNEAGYVMHRMFTTGIVLRRLSATLIETVNHEFYKLLGSLNDNKNIIPKELVKQCRNGCPAKIEQFCETWETLQNGKVQELEEKCLDTSMDSLNTHMSSRGRRILPPLCYWTGERISLKDNNPVYISGNSKELSSLSQILSGEEHTEKTKQKEDSKNIPKKQGVNKQKQSLESNETSRRDKNQSRKGKAANSPRRSSVVCKQRIAQQLLPSSYFTEEEQEISPRKRLCKSQPNTNAGAEAQNTMSNKPQKIEASSNRASQRAANKPKHYTNYSSTRKSYRNMTCTYYENTPLPEDLLSEDQVSLI